MGENIFERNDYYLNNMSYMFNHNYIKARKYIGICNNYNLGKIMLFGSKSLDLINHYSIKKFNEQNFKAGSTIIIKNKKLISEVFVYKLSALRYIIACENLSKIHNFFMKAKRKFPLTTISDVTNKYCIFSFHGNEANNFFKEINYNHLFKINHQNYYYYNLIVNKKDEFITLEQFKKNNFIPISIETKNIFLYNNNVLTHMEKIKKRLQKYVFNFVSNYQNLNTLKNKHLKKDIYIRQFELQENFLIFKGNYIYNSKGKKSGIIHCSYRIPNKRNPYIICIMWKNRDEKIATLRKGKKDILLKQFQFY